MASHQPQPHHGLPTHPAHPASTPRSEVRLHNRAAQYADATTELRRVRLVHISDTHNVAYPAVPDGDILIHSGDFSDGGTPAEVAAFSLFLRSLPHAVKIVVGGNHEFGLDRHTNEQIREMIGGDDPRIHFLQDSTVEVHGIRFYGSAWTHSHGSWGVDVATRSAKWALIPADTDVLITHSPPFGIMDNALDGRNKSHAQCSTCSKVHPHFAHWGCPALLSAVQTVRPRIHMFGHVHDETGVVETDHTVFSNAAMDVRYRPSVIDVVVPLVAIAPSIALSPPLDEDVHISHPATGTVVDIDLARTAPGSSVILWRELAGPRANQRWALRRTHALASDAADTTTAVLIQSRMPQAMFLVVDAGGKIVVDVVDDMRHPPPVAMWMAQQALDSGWQLRNSATRTWLCVDEYGMLTMGPESQAWMLKR